MNARRCPSAATRLVRAVSWRGRLQRDAVASRVIGPRGGTITLRRLGTSLRVPAGALTQPTAITLRAVAGPSVVYGMEPRGLRFVSAARLHIGLARTGSDCGARGQRPRRGAMRGAYIASPGEIGADGLVSAYEEMAAVPDASTKSTSFAVAHFSVVILASQVVAGGPPRHGHR